MNEWKPNHGFLDFLLDRFNEEGHIDHPMVSIDEYSITKRDLIQEMRLGTDLGRKVYSQWHDDPICQKLYSKYLSEYDVRRDQPEQE